MDNDNHIKNKKYLKDKIGDIGELYKYDLLKDFLQGKYSDDDYLYNFYSSCVEQIERTNLPNCIYELLWGWTEQNKDNCYDIMNSFNTYMNKIITSMINNDEPFKDAYDTYKEILGVDKPKPSQRLVLYFIRNDDLKIKMVENLVEMIHLSKWTNTIGNFIILPKTERGKRGENVYKNGTAKDRMDLYLKNLTDPENPQKHFDEEEFKEYINQNYLWDYVNKKYKVIPLFNSDNNNIEKKLPNDPKCYKALAENIIKKIKRRGMFMEIMIRLSSELPDIFEEVKNTKDKSSYAEVIGEIEEKRKEEEERKNEEINLSENLKSLISDLMN